ncbi:hypothetical protein BDN70DRAFT_963613 [Pholiota conissans]|uniref:Uncharacterized protein n=1 Tax=Pholiota conissans TaxID=109636 RepID=A0A9P5YSD0_9AGAR|nr:hypothetical protein BDN70DRAFT_963613 [Pholiota conissans]
MSTQLIPTLQMNLGALLIGVLVSCFLFGIVTLQMYLYYMKFPNDSIRLKSMYVAVLKLSCRVCELGLTICVCHILYYLTIVGYGEPRYFFTLPASLASAVIFSGIIGPIVQMFFAERIRKISGGKLIISILCWIMAWFRLVMSFVTAAKTIRINSITEFQVQCKWLLTTVLAVCVAVDFVIAVSLCYYLTKRKAQSMERKANFSIIYLQLLLIIL